MLMVLVDSVRDLGLRCDTGQRNSTALDLSIVATGPCLCTYDPWIAVELVSGFYYDVSHVVGSVSGSCRDMSNAERRSAINGWVLERMA